MNKEEWEDFVDILSNRIDLNNFGEVPNKGEFENHTDMIWLKIRGWNFIKEKLEQQKKEYEEREVKITNRVECVGFSEEPDFECKKILPISEMQATVKEPYTFYCKDCYRRGVEMENEAIYG